MLTLKLGNINNATLHIDKAACDTLQGITSESLSCDGSLSSHVIHHVKVLWRVGEYLLGVPTVNKESHTRIILASEHVIDVEYPA